MCSSRSPYNPDSLEAIGRERAMRVFHGIPPAAERRPCVLSIGNFDGVHRGHRALLQQAVDASRQSSLIAAAMTFEPHPREYLDPGRAPSRVANLRDKVEGLRLAGIERVYVEHFSRRFAALSAECFVREVLVEGCAVRRVLVGDDFRFGAGRAGDLALLRRMGRDADFEVEQIGAINDAGGRISSSRIRAALQNGDLAGASDLLGHPYAISGRVLHGSKLGRQLGFPTLNLRLAHRRPAVHGIFAVRVEGIAQMPWPGVASVGLRPTVDDSGRWLLEVHLFDFSGNLYGRLVRVRFVQRLRDEARFESIAELAEAIRADAQHARAILNGVLAVG
jgi:riboflavin kinase / FMN adenylyltransferase